MTIENLATIGLRFDGDPLSLREIVEGGEIFSLHAFEGDGVRNVVADGALIQKHGR